MERSLFAQAGKLEPGLVVAFASLDDSARATDLTVTPNVSLYVEAGKAPTPFLPGGKFIAVWTGFVAVDIRSDYTFEAELNGDFKLEINSTTVLEVAGKGDAAAPSKPFRLRKGTNALTATFRSPAQGDAFIRLFWFNKETVRQPIPLAALTCSAANAALEQASRIRLGRQLFVEFRCAKCHSGPSRDSGMPELAMDAPSFEGIGSRRNYDWLARWITDPKALRPTAHMPKLLHGPKAREDAEAAAAFLVSLRSEVAGKSVASKEPSDEDKEFGRKLFETLHCVACHNAPEAMEVDEMKISLKQVREKFSDGMLGVFLANPEAHYAWIRMPRFKLTADEIRQLTGYLNAAADKPKETPAPTDSTVIESGRKLVQTSGCLNCHGLKLENQFSAKPLAELALDKWKQGCLSGSLDDASKAPQFSLTPADREALQAFAATDRSSLARHVPAEFAERQIRLSNCRECHGKFEGVPPLDMTGAKLKPEWTKAFISGEVAYKPRPWLDARMPAFPNRAEALAGGMAMQHGYPSKTTVEPPVDMDAAKVGQKLISAVGGFSCISCHGVGEMAATQVFEAPGINLVYSGDRLLKPYFQRWLRSPIQIDPSTKMPAYFDEEGKSPLVDFYEGNGTKQIDAIWQYLRLGDKMPPPPTQ